MALVEYRGQYYDIALPHGQFKSCQEKYVRTDPDILEKAYHLNEERKKPDEIIEVIGGTILFELRKTPNNLET